MRSANFKLLRQIKGNSINNSDILMFIICQGRPFLLLASGIKKLDTPLNADSLKTSLMRSTRH